MKTTVIGDDFGYEIKMLGHYSREVMLEQLSKAGNDGRNAIRSAMESHTSRYVTRVRNGRAYLERGGALPFGHRESHTVDKETSHPDNMSMKITSFISEPKATVVVGGMHPRFTPLKRRNGEVVGTMKPVDAVSPESYAILVRMNTGEITDRYPKRSQLSTANIGKGYVPEGIAASRGSVRHRLTQGYEQVFRRVQIRERKIRHVI